MAEPLLFAKRDGIATLTLNRPDVGNAINTALIEALAQASAQCERDASIRCVVLTGAGRLFCVGGDIGVMQTASDNGGAAIGQFARTLHVAVARLARMNKPLLCVVNGPAARSEEHTSELQSLMRISYAVFCLKKKKISDYYTRLNRQKQRHN